jgi:hypothetical protein
VLLDHFFSNPRRFTQIQVYVAGRIFVGPHDDVYRGVWRRMRRRVGGLQQKQGAPT